MRPKLNLYIVDPASGRPRPGALVTFYYANTLSLAPLFADDDLSQVANPTTADALGTVAVRVPPGIFDIAMSWEGSQPTLVQDILAWTPEAAVIVAQGDLIIGAPTGGPMRLPAGATGRVLMMQAGLPAWADFGAEDLLPPGTDGQVLMIVDGEPQWATYLPLPPGSLLPISAQGDLVKGSTAGLPERLPIGTEGQSLTVVGGDLAWGGAGFDSPMTTLGDLIVGGIDGVGERLGIGAQNSILTSIGGIPVWAGSPLLNLIEQALPLEAARFPDGTAGNLFPAAAENVSTATGLPANTVKIVDFVYNFNVSLQQTLLWKVFVPAGWGLSTVHLITKWRCATASGQVLIRASLGPVLDSSTDLNAPLFNTATVSAPLNVPGVIGQQIETRLQLDQLAGVQSGRALFVMFGFIPSGVDPGQVTLEHARLEWAR